ncbi:MAG: hypothetical protein IH951_11780 [Bacteroidetes bacterium]|nr:hypothetical protein [Bacteroidota bacterium]
MGERSGHVSPCLIQITDATPDHFMFISMKDKVVGNMLTFVGHVPGKWPLTLSSTEKYLSTDPLLPITFVGKY